MRYIVGNMSTKNILSGIHGKSQNQNFFLQVYPTNKPVYCLYKRC